MAVKSPRNKTNGRRCPLCVTCMWAVGMARTEIDWRTGFSNAVGTMRVRLGKAWLPVRALGGQHNPTNGEAGCATSCNTVSGPVGVKFKKFKRGEKYTEHLIADVDHAWHTMARRPIPPWRMQCLFPDAGLIDLF